MDEERLLSLPAHFFRWDVKRAATFRVLVRLWEFGDYERDKVWCFLTDAQLVTDCGLTGQRHLQRCLADLYEAGLVEREAGVDGRHGFRLYNREPYAETRGPRKRGRQPNVKFDVSKRQTCHSQTSTLTSTNVNFDRTTLLENRRAEESVDQPTLFALEPDPSPSVKTPRKSRSKDGLTDEDAGRLFAAQQAARAQVARRIGKSIGPASLLPGLRKAMDKAFALYPDVDGLCGAMAYRGKTDKTAEQLRWLSGASAWSEKPIGIAYANRIDVANAAPEDGPDENGWMEEPI